MLVFLHKSLRERIGENDAKINNCPKLWSECISTKCAEQPKEAATTRLLRDKKSRLVNAAPFHNCFVSAAPRRVNLIPQAVKAAAMSGTIGQSCASQLLGRLSSGPGTFCDFPLNFFGARSPPFPFRRRAKGVAVRSPKI